MPDVDDKGLDFPFRKSVFNWVKARLSKLVKNHDKPVNGKALIESMKSWEAKSLMAATSKEDYVQRMDELYHNLSKVLAAPSNAGNEVTSSYMMSTENQPSQMQVSAPLSTMLLSNGVLQNQHFEQQNAQLGLQNQNIDQLRQQNVIPRDRGYQLAQENGMHGYKQSPESFNGQMQNVTSQSQFSSPRVKTEGQTHHVQDGRVQALETPTAYAYPQSNMPRTSGALASTSSTEGGATNSDEHELLISQVQRAKSMYMLEYTEYYKGLVARYHQAQIASEREKLKRDAQLVHNFIKFMSYPKEKLIHFDKQTLRKNLLAVMGYYNQNIKKTATPVVNQAPRVASTNVSQNTRTASTPMANPGVLYSDSSAAGSSRHGSVISMEQNTGLNTKQDRQMNQSSIKTESPETPQSVNQSEKRKRSVQTINKVASNLPDTGNDLTNFMSKLGTNVTSKQPEKGNDIIDPTVRSSPNPTKSNASKKPCSKPPAKSSGSAHESWLNLAGNRSQKRSVPSRLSRTSMLSTDSPSTPITPKEHGFETKAIRDTIPVSQPRNSLLPYDSPSTPVTPSSVLKENGFETEIIREEWKSQEQPKVEDHFLIHGSSETLPSSPMVTACMGLGPESIYQVPEKQPIDRLLDAVKACSKESLSSAVNDMKSALTEMDQLPDYAYDDDSIPTTEDDLEAFIQSLLDEDTEEQPTKIVKRDLESVSRDTSFPPNNLVDCPPSNHPSRALLEEIRQTNQKLSWTEMKIASTESSNPSNGTIVRCTYNPAAMGGADIIRKLFAVSTINISVEFLVPLNYPSSPPKILDYKLPDYGIGIEMTEKTKSLFENQLRCVDPLRVGNTGEAWDFCAQSVFVAYAKHFGVDELISENGGMEPYSTRSRITYTV